MFVYTKEMWGNKRKIKVLNGSLGTIPLSARLLLRHQVYLPDLVFRVFVVVLDFNKVASDGRFNDRSSLYGQFHFKSH